MTTRIRLLFLGFLAIIFIPTFAQATDTNSTFSERLQEMQQKREAFLKARSEALDSRLQNVERREELMKTRAANRKEVLLKIVGVQISYFERMEDRIAKMPNITDEEKTRLTAAVDEVIADLNSLKTQIENASVDDEDVLKNLAQQVFDLFKSKRTLVQEIVKSIHTSHLTRVLSRANERAAAIETKINELQTDGKDVTSLTTLLTKAKASLSEAQTQITAGEFHDALASIKEAYSLFRQIIQAGKDL